MATNLTMTFEEESLVVDGVTFHYRFIPQLISALTRPDPRKWYRFERSGDNVIVHVKITEEEPNGSRIANIGADTGDG